MNIKEILAKWATGAVSSLKVWAVQLVMETERTIPGESAERKRAYVVQRLDDMVKLPWYFEPFDGPAFGLIVDYACDKLNLVMGHEWTDLSPEQVKKVAAVIDAPVTEVSGQSIDERIEALYKKYGIK
ncbi:hypothetical protein [Cloacibacillus evryensis]|uniref:hypothetical protein n=1 Tax=Cloacibacillus evryensis TaxID=508460 RepID=UPI002B20EAAA|nr:hypothetical protein [Cloacibacillus evryensis]MEA5034252.1 hypothetical protein [Cloacibacillus evryensis]